MKSVFGPGRDRGGRASGLKIPYTAKVSRSSYSPPKTSSLVRSAGGVALFTMGSRLLGFIRDVLIAARLGTGAVADAFFVAWGFPNLFRAIFAEGAFFTAFVPLFARRLEDDSDDARRFAGQALALLTAILLVVTVIIQMAMPWILLIVAGGFSDSPEKFTLAVMMTQIMFPYLIFMSMVALLGGILNSARRFWVIAAAPMLLNAALIAALAVVVPGSASPGTTLAWTIILAGVAQFVFVLAVTMRIGLAPRFPRPRWTPDMRRFLALALPAILSGGAFKISGLVDSALASWQDGAVSFIAYAARLYNLPIGLIGITVGVVILPDLVSRLRRADSDGAHRLLIRAIELAMLLAVPAAVGLAILALPVILVLFARGQFSFQDTIATSRALIAFAPAIPAMVLVQILAVTFFAREDTRTPLYAAATGVGINIVAGILFFLQIGYVGIALASSLSAWINAGLLTWRARRAGYLQPFPQFNRRLLAILVSAAGMGIALWAAMIGAGSWFSPDESGALTRVAALAGLIGGGGIVFAVLCQTTGAMRWSEFFAIIRR